MKKSVIDTFEATGDIPKWKPEVGAMVTVFEDIMTQHKYEGIAKVVKIHSKRDGILDCDVKFTGDSQVVRRQIKYLKCS